MTQLHDYKKIIRYIKMTESENACKSNLSNCGRTKDSENLSQDQKESENLYKEIRDILNMLTPQNFAELMYLVKILPIYTMERLETVIELVSEKAIRDERYSKCYASMCNQLSEVQIPYQNEEGRDLKYNLTKLIITKCQSEIESEIQAELDEERRLEEIRNYADPELYKKVRGILNKLTPQKFDKLIPQLKSLPINTVERLERVIDLVYEKAVDEPGFSKFYASMCKQLSELEISYQNEEGKDVKSNFRKLIITKCQSEFESGNNGELDAEKRLEEIRNCADSGKKKELQSTFEEDQRRVRRKSVGNIKFIGELFKLGMLTPGIMFRCLQSMLKKPTEESLECLCKLLASIGKDLEASYKVALLNPILNQMHNLSQKHEDSKVSSRVRFMLQDVIDLRKNRWIPRRDDNNPKTIDEITKDAERETLEMNIALNQPRAKNYDTHQDDRRGRQWRDNNQSDWFNSTGVSNWCLQVRQRMNEFPLTFQEAERRVRMKFVGNIRFIGELFKLGLITPDSVFPYLQSMLMESDNISLECLCNLLAAIGKDLELSKDAASLNPIFNQMHDLAQKNENSKVSSRVRLMLQEVIDLRENNWILRPNHNTKMINKILNKAERETRRETSEINMALNQICATNYNIHQDDLREGYGRNNDQSDVGRTAVSIDNQFDLSKLPIMRASNTSSSLLKHEVD